MEKERVELDPDYKAAISIDEIRELTGNESISNFDEFKSHFEGIQKPEVVKETVPFEFQDDYIKGAHDYYSKHGDLSPYIQNNVDYEKMSPEQIIRMEIKEANQGLSDKAVDHLTKAELKKYELDEDAEEDERSLQQELLGVRVNSNIDKLKEKQKKFNAPEKPSVDLERWASTVNDSDVTKGLLEGKNLEFKHDETSFNLEIPEPNRLVDMTIDNTEFFKLFASDGKTDLSKWYKVIAYAQNPEAFEKELIKHGQSIGTESVVDELKNQELQRKSATPDGETLMEAFANRGRVVK